MRTNINPRDLAVDLLPRSTRNVQVASVIADDWGIFAWGWNSEGPDGFGLCAERHAISRSKKSRLDGATIYVASKWNGRDKLAPAKPCDKCRTVIYKNDLKICYRDRDGEWREE